MRRILLSFFFILCASVSFAYDVEVDGIYYNLVNKTKTAEVTYKGSTFYEVKGTYSGSVDIPTKINVSEIEYTVTSIGEYAFYQSSLTSVTIPNSVNSIGKAAFSSCSNLTSVTIPNSVTSIEEGAFIACKNLTSITIPNSVISIGENAFYYCSSLTSMTIPNSVISIGQAAFWGCSSLTSVIIPNSVTSIGSSVFYQCSNLTSVTIPNSVTSIEGFAFYGCSSLTSMTIPNSVTSIGKAAFYDCSNLISLTIPNSVTSIGEDAFSDCNSLTSVTIPNSVTSIEEGAFANCSSLTSLTIGSSVQNIGYAAFWACKELNTVICFATLIPSTDSKAFYNSNIYNVTLIVPKTSLQSYKTTSPWSEFGTFKTIGSTTPGRQDVAIIDNCSTYSHEEEECKTISYSRDFTDTNWQSLYVPFSMSYDDWKDDFEVAYINDVRQYDDNEDGIADRTEVEVFKMKEGKSIEPNTPYLIKTKTTGEKTITLEDATLYQTEENSYDVTSWFTRFNFIGTYHTISNMASNGYYAMSDGTLKQATSDAATLQPFRWYLSVTDRNGNPVTLNSKSMSIVFDDGEATGIETISNETKESTSIHTLTGISKGNDMKNLAPGIYIKNGKKFIVK